MLDIKTFKKYKALSFFGIFLVISIVILFIVFKEHFNSFLLQTNFFYYGHGETHKTSGVIAVWETAYNATSTAMHEN